MGFMGQKKFEKKLWFFSFLYNYLLFFIDFHWFCGKVGKLYEMSDYGDNKSLKSNYSNKSVRTSW